MIYELEGKRPIFEGDGHFIAETAAVMGRVTMGPNSSVWFSAVVRGDVEVIEIGESSNVQDGAVLHADPGSPLHIGAYVTIGHQAMIHGCTIGDNSLIGINAVILNGAKIGRNCLIGANALVTENTVIEDGSMVLGSPAKIIKPLALEQQQALKSSAVHYAENAARFRNSLKKL